MMGTTAGGASALLRGMVSVGALALALLATSVPEARAQEGGAGEGGRRAAPPAPAPSQLGLIRRPLILPGQQRSYSYYVSSKAERGGFNLVVYALPDNGQSPDDFARQSGWIKLAEDNGFVVVILGAADGKWAPQSRGETDYVKGVYDDVTGVLTRPVRGPERTPAPFGAWLPFHYLTGAGAGARVAQAFAMDYPGLYAAVATLDGGPFRRRLRQGR